MSPGIYGDVDLSELDKAGAPPDGGQRERGDGAAPAPTDTTAPIPGAGYLLEEPDESKVFKAIDQIVKAQERLAKNRAAAAKHWGRVRRGVPFSVLTKSEDRAEWRAELPPGVNDAIAPIPNKADDLCGRIVDQVVVDPFSPEPKPENESDRARRAAEIAKKFLKRDGGESGTNDQEVLRQLLDVAMTHASAYAHLWVDPQGDGWRPLRIKAHPFALDASNPLVGPDGNPSAEYILRYVTEGGQFTQNPAEAARQWLPKIRRDLLDSANVRTVPETAPVADAPAVILLMVQPLSEARRRFPVLREMPDEDVKALCDWRPARAKVLVPDAMMGRFKAQEAHKGERGDSAPSDNALVFWYQKYCRSGGDYPDGAEIVVNGAMGGVVLKRATLRKDIEVPDTTPDAEPQQMAPQAMPDGTEAPPMPQASGPALRPVIRSIPVAQCKTLHDTQGKDPNGRPPIELFGGTNEARAQLYGAVLEDADRRLHPNIFLTANSTVQGWQVTQRTSEPIVVETKDDMPKYEEFADLPSFTPNVLERLDRDMETAAKLSEGMATGLEGPTSGQSGVAKEAVIRQAKVALASIYQNVTAFIMRYWRLKTELGQCELTVPQQVEHTGEDGASQQRWWAGSDLVGVSDVSIQPGSGTMMSPAEKQQYLMLAQQSGWVLPEEAADAGRSTVADDLGLKPNQHERLVEKQIAQWTDGPPEGWMPSMPMMDELGAPVLDPMTGQPAMQPASYTPFEPRPTDEDPAVAPVRYRKLRDFIAGSEYAKHTPEWRSLVDLEYQRMRQAAGVATMAEQQMAMQQQAQAEADAQAEDQEGQAVEADKSRAFEGEQAERDRADKRSDRTQERALKLATASPAEVA